MKNLIVGTLCNYKFCNIEPFFVSMRRYMNVEDVDCIMFVNNISNYCKRRLSELYNVIIIDSKCCSKDEIDVYRWSEFYTAIEDCDYEFVLASDVGDVFFQGNVFENCCRDRITIALETSKLKDEFNNRSWFTKSFGEDEFQKYKNETVVCCGTIMGPCDMMIDVLKKLSQIITHKSRFHEFGVAQAAFQYLVYEEGIDNFNASDVYTGELFTAVHLEDFNIKDKVLYSYKGIIPKLIHEYDLAESLVDIVEEKYRDIYRDDTFKYDNLSDSFEECIYSGNFKRAIILGKENELYIQKYYRWTEIIPLYIIALHSSHSVDRGKVVDCLFHMLLRTRINDCNIYYLRLLKDMNANRLNLLKDSIKFKELFERVAEFYKKENQTVKAELFNELIKLY